jgi:hypothetical protein
MGHDLDIGSVSRLDDGKHGADPADLGDARLHDIYGAGGEHAVKVAKQSAVLAGSDPYALFADLRESLKVFRGPNRFLEPK